MWKGKDKGEFFRTIRDDQELKHQFDLVEKSQRKQLQIIDYELKDPTSRFDLGRHKGNITLISDSNIYLYFAMSTVAFILIMQVNKDELKFTIRLN